MVEIFPSYYYFRFAFLVLPSIIAKHIDEIERLLAKNNCLVNVFMYGYHRRSLLHKAAEIGDRRICKLLIDHGADVNKQDAKKRTPLWIAAEKGHEDVCDVLMQNDAFVDKPDASKKTPLWIAASKGHENVCQILIDNGAECLASHLGIRDSGIGFYNIFERFNMSHRYFKWFIEYGKMINLYYISIY